MHRKYILAVFGAVLAALLVSSAVASASSGTAVTVRVEGVRRTLLAPAVVHAPTGSLTKFGAPSGACPADSAAGVLDRATHHRWVGSWSSSYDDYEITSILGESHTFSSRYYWQIFVNNAPAAFGVCGLKLHRGEQLLFAAVPDKGTEYPIVLSATGVPTAGQPFDLTVSYVKHGKRKPLAGALITGSGTSTRSNQHGLATITPAAAGRMVVHASEKGFIRAAPLTVSVTG